MSWRPGKAGARKKDRSPDFPDEALGRSHGGFITKIHIRSEGLGKPVTVTVTGGQVHDSRLVRPLIDRGAIRRLGRGRARPAKIAGDKAYSRRASRRAMRQHGIVSMIPAKANEHRQRNLDREARRKRNIVERLINRLKNFQRIATRYEKRAENHLGMTCLGAILPWL